MKLLALPLELFQEVITHAVHLAEPHESQKWRAVCKIFDREVQRAFYAHPVFDIVHTPTKDIGWDAPGEMSEEVTVRLVRAKVTSSVEKLGPIQRAIAGTVRFLEIEVGQDAAVCESIADALLNCAAWDFPVLRILRSLAPGNDQSFEDYIGYAIIGAVVTNNESLVKALLEKSPRYLPEHKCFEALTGYDSDSDSEFESDTEFYPARPFGHRWKAAQKLGSESMTRMLLDHALGSSERNAAFYKYRAKVLAETMYWKTPLVMRMIVNEYGPDSAAPYYDRAIIYSLRDANESTAEFLLDHRVPLQNEDGANADTSPEVEFWHDLLQAAVSVWYDGERMLITSERIARRVLDRGHPSRSDMAARCFERRALSMNPEEIRFLLENVPGPLSTYIGALEVAAGEGDIPLIDLILDHGASIDGHGPKWYFNPLSSACFAKSNYLETTRHLLDRGACVQYQSVGKEVLRLAVLDPNPIWSREGMAELVGLLLDAGADPMEIVDVHGRVREDVDRNVRGRTHGTDGHEHVNEENLRVLKERAGVA